MLNRLILLLTFASFSASNAALHKLQDPKLKSFANRFRFESQIDSDQEFPDSDEDDSQKELTQFDREVLFTDLLENKEHEKIDIFDLINLCELTNKFTAEDIKKLVSSTEKRCGKNIISLSELYLSFYLMRQTAEVSHDLRSLVISKIFLPKYGINRFFASLNTLTKFTNPTFNLVNINLFFQRAKLKARLDKTEITDEIIKDVLSAYFKIYNINDLTVSSAVIPSTLIKNNHVTNIPNVFIRYQQDNRFQLIVRDQMSVDGGGRLSCGYHSAKNGLAIAHLLLGNNLENFVYLSLPASVRRFENNTSDARNGIIKLRHANALLNVCCDALVLSLRGNKRIIQQTARPEGTDHLTFRLNTGNQWVIFDSIEKNIDLDRFKLRELIVNIAHELRLEFQRVILDGQQNVIVGRNHCLKILHDIIIKRAAEEATSEIYKRLINQEYLNSFFTNLTDINLVIEADGIRARKLIHENPIITQLTGDQYSQIMGRNGNLLGENLDGQEVRLLYGFRNVIKKSDEDPGIPFKVINISDDDGQDPFREIDANLLKEIRDPNLEMFVMCNIHLPNHWINCVMHKVKDQIKYYITDSHANNNQINNPLILKLLYYLETGQVENEVATTQPKIIKESNNANNIESENVAIKVIPADKIEFDLDRDFLGVLPPVVNTVINDLQGKNGKKTIRSLYLYGPPGLGKSSIAYGIAKRTGRTLIECTCASAITKWQGSGSDTVIELFKIAKERNEPVIILIEEIDGIGKSRELNASQTVMEAGMTLAKAIVDSTNDPNIFIIATTNKANQVEPALNSRLNESLAIKMPPLEADTALEILAKVYHDKTKLNLNYYVLEELRDHLDNLEIRAIIGIVNNLIGNNILNPRIDQWITAINDAKEFIAAQNKESEDEKNAKDISYRLNQLQYQNLRNSMHTHITQRTRDNIRDGLAFAQGTFSTLNTGFQAANSFRNFIMPGLGGIPGMPGVSPLSAMFGGFFG